MHFALQAAIFIRATVVRGSEDELSSPKRADTPDSTTATTQGVDDVGSPRDARRQALGDREQDCDVEEDEGCVREAVPGDAQGGRRQAEGGS